jgi:hypothetical protein
MVRSGWVGYSLVESCFGQVAVGVAKNIAAQLPWSVLHGGYYVQE